VILEAAVTVFLREGYDRASVDTIAEGAGVAKQTVYNHFGDKERLFLAAVEHERGRIAAGFTDGEPEEGAGRTPAATRAPDAATELLGLARRVLAALLDERSTALRRLVISQLGHQPTLYAALDDEPAPLVRALADAFRARTARGELWIGEPSIAAKQFVGLLMQQGSARTRYGTQRLVGEEFETICRQTVGLFLRAFRPSTRPVRGPGYPSRVATLR
jgi:TetR/AcrR family transcriptional repressor of mexJK operon